jgi:hypothetical protein
MIYPLDNSLGHAKYAEIKGLELIRAVWREEADSDIVLRASLMK